MISKLLSLLSGSKHARLISIISGVIGGVIAFSGTNNVPLSIATGLIPIAIGFFKKQIISVQKKLIKGDSKYTNLISLLSGILGGLAAFLFTEKALILVFVSALMPLLLLVLKKPLDNASKPIYNVLGSISKWITILIGMALPVLLIFAFNSITDNSNTAILLGILIGAPLSSIIMRKPAKA